MAGSKGHFAASPRTGPELLLLRPAPSVPAFSRSGTVLQNPITSQSGTPLQLASGEGDATLFTFSLPPSTPYPLHGLLEKWCVQHCARAANPTVPVAICLVECGLLKGGQPLGRLEATRGGPRLGGVPLVLWPVAGARPCQPGPAFHSVALSDAVHLPCLSGGARRAARPLRIEAPKGQLANS